MSAAVILRRRTYDRCVKTIRLYLECRDLYYKPFDYVGVYGRPLELCSRAEALHLWNKRADAAALAAVAFLKQFRKTCAGIGLKSWYLHCMPKHLPDCIRKFGVLAKYSTEFGESGHSWTNQVLVSGSNSIPGERMLQVMTAKTLEEYTVEQNPDIAADELRREQRQSCARKGSTETLCCLYIRYTRRSCRRTSKPVW